jgi:hypothetical protein
MVDTCRAILQRNSEVDFADFSVAEHNVEEPIYVAWPDSYGFSRQTFADE